MNTQRQIVITGLQALCFAAVFLVPVTQAASFIETPSLRAAVEAGRLPPVGDRLPANPLYVDLEAQGRQPGLHGGSWRMFIGKSKHQRYANVYGYARLVGFNQALELKPDILKGVRVEEGRRFILWLRDGHKWSDGAPFTAEDFRYYWQDIANNPALSPSGPPAALLLEGEAPQVRFPNETTVIYEWSKPNPTFLRLLAQARPPFIYRPAHYLKKYHAKYTDQQTMAFALAGSKARNWAQLHNRKDNMYKGDNPDLPTLQPWHPTESENGYRFVWLRNPYYHRVDSSGRQLPYIDSLDMAVASTGLIPAKVIAGEADLQARGLPFSEAAVLKEGEKRGDYQMRVWANGVASEIAIYPNLNYKKQQWREIMRDKRFRRALSLAIKREAINRALFFELGKPAAVSLLPTSPLYDDAHASAFAAYDPARANAILDAMGFTQRDSDNIRLLPNGERLEVVIETAGERIDVEKTLQFITRNWADIGVKLIIRPNDRDILRNRVYSGDAMMAVWFGWDNGQATPIDPPSEQTPLRQDTFSWPKWGQHYQTKGAAGEPPDYPPALRLLALATAWERAITDADRLTIWREILAIHADEIFAIGIINAAPQLVTVTNLLRNVPQHGIWSWDPGANFGVYRPDEFFFADQ